MPRRSFTSLLMVILCVCFLIPSCGKREDRVRYDRVERRRVERRRVEHRPRRHVVRKVHVEEPSPRRRDARPDREVESRHKDRSDRSARREHSERSERTRNSRN